MQISGRPKKRFKDNINMIFSRQRGWEIDIKGSGLYLANYYDLTSVAFPADIEQQ